MIQCDVFFRLHCWFLGSPRAAPAAAAVPAQPVRCPQQLPVLTGDGGVQNPLPEPPDVLPVHHVATVSLIAQINPATSLPELAYQGNNAGLAPTIRVNPGDTIVMDVTDALPHYPKNGDELHAYMNIHFHGLTVSPNPPADNVMTMLTSPGNTLHYVVPIPKGQEPGLYWYHPHVYQTTDYHVGQAGMSGMIIVNGLEHHLRGLAKMTERTIVIRATGIQRRDSHARPLPHVRKAGTCAPDPGLTVTTNGAVRPTIAIDPGEKQFFRVVNATGHKKLRLAVNGGDLDLVAIDGFALDVYPGTGPTEKVQTSSYRRRLGRSSSSPDPPAAKRNSGRCATTPVPTAIRIRWSCWRTCAHRNTRRAGRRRPL